MQKIWQTTSKLHPLVEKFTVGEDHIYDQIIFPFKLQVADAHAQMLTKKNILKKEELKKIQSGISQMQALWEAGEFEILPEQEDGYTAIEQFLTEKFGDIGKKLPTGRSRNEVTAPLRLYMKSELKSLKILVKNLKTNFEKKAKTHKNTPLPGYTHAQKAMPTTVSVWLSSFSAGLSDQFLFLDALEKLLDQSPLGSASGFGIANFENDRDFTTQILGFGKVQENVMYCGLSRGHFENQFLQTFSPMLLLLSRFVNDGLCFTMSEFDYFSLPENMTTGSSIMPQKRNYDVLEMTRGRIGQFFSVQQEIQNLCQNLISGYHRDLQLTKKIFLNAVVNLKEILEILNLVVENLEFNRKNLERAMTEEVYLTEKVYDLVNQGIPFREAYQQIKKEFFGNP